MSRLKKLLMIVVGLIGAVILLIYLGQLLFLREYGKELQSGHSEILNLDQKFKSYPAGFPSDPGEAGKKTIEGIDADHDGIRDDVQRWIYAFVPNEHKKQMALRQEARVYFKYLLSDQFDAKLIAQAMASLDMSLQCMHEAFTDEIHGFKEGIYLEAKILNTFSRVKRLWDNNGKIQQKDFTGVNPDRESPCENK
jgi:hypothetical protein